MYSGGYGFFEHLLPAIGQPASYFVLQNRHWRIIALDSAYVNHSFTKPQIEWLEAQLDGSAKTVLLTHHHLFSPFRKPGDKLDICINRDGQERTLTITAGVLPFHDGVGLE